MLFIVQSENGSEIIDANCEFDAAGEYAAKQAGFGSEHPRWDPFSFTVNGQEYSAEMLVRTSLGTGAITVSTDDESRNFDEQGNEYGDLRGLEID